MQEYAFIPSLDMEAKDFWEKCAKTEKENRMDGILAYMWMMCRESEGKVLITKDNFREQGKKVKLFPGVQQWFSMMNKYASGKNIALEHYIISSGLKEIIEGTSIAEAFTEIFAASFCYNEKNVPVWPAMAVNYTSKTQFLFRINKGVHDVTEHNSLNEYTPENERRMPFRNMIFIGDGMTDVPCMRLVKANGGHSIAVYQPGASGDAKKLLKQRRVDYAFEADYGRDKPLANAVKMIIDQIAAVQATTDLHKKHMEQADNAYID